MRLIGDPERRARMARRHALAPQCRVADPQAISICMRRSGRGLALMRAGRSRASMRLCPVRS